MLKKRANNLRPNLSTIATILLASLYALPMSGFAQNAATPAAPATPPAYELSEIIVTAQRQSESSQRAAIAISVVTGEDIVNAGLTQVNRLGELVPALTVEPTSTGNLLFMRGVGNFNVATGGDPTIAFNYDGVYIGRTTSTVGMFYDLERIEVLKGPQGTLYGRNATGGAINILPAQPRIGQTSGFANVSLGNYNSVAAEAALNAAIGNNTAVRFSASVSNHDGYLSDGTSDDKTSSARLQIKSELSPGSTIRVAADYSHMGGLGSSVSYLSSNVYSAALGKFITTPSGLSISEGILSPASQAYRQTIRLGPAGRNLDALAGTPFVDNTFKGFNVEFSTNTAIGTLTVTPAWRDTNLDYLSSAGAFFYRQREKDKQSSFEARLAGIAGMLDYLVGGYYYKETINATTALTLSFQSTYLNPDISTKSTAPFGRLTAHLSDALRLVGGLRYTTDSKSFKQTTTGLTAPCVVVINGVPTCPTAVLIPLVDSYNLLPYSPLPAAGGAPVVLPTGLRLVRTDRVDDSQLKKSKLTGRAAVEYDIAPQSLLYASYETGYRSGGFSAAQGFETFEPEYLTAYTVGMKNKLLDRRLQVNIEAFKWDYKNQQIQHLGLDTRGITANFTQNIGASKIQGLEVDTRYLATPNTLLSATVQYLDAKTLTFVYQQAAPAVGAAPPLTGCAISPVAGTTPALINVDCSGFANYNSPKWTINLAAQQTIDLSGKNKLVLGIDTQRKSERNTGFAYLPEQVVGSSTTSNAQISYGPDDERWSVSAYVRNIEDKRLPVYSTFHPIALITLAGTTAPRTVGMRLMAKF